MFARCCYFSVLATLLSLLTLSATHLPRQQQLRKNNTPNWHHNAACIVLRARGALPIARNKLHITKKNSCRMLIGGGIICTHSVWFGSCDVFINESCDGRTT